MNRMVVQQLELNQQKLCEIESCLQIFIEEQTLAFFNAVRHADHLFVRNLSNDFTGLEVADGDDGPIDGFVHLETQITAVVLELLVQVINGLFDALAQVFSVVAQVHFFRRFQLDLGNGNSLDGLQTQFLVAAFSGCGRLAGRTADFGSLSADVTDIHDGLLHGMARNEPVVEMSRPKSGNL